MSRESAVKLVITVEGGIGHEPVHQRNNPEVGGGPQVFRPTCSDRKCVRSVGGNATSPEVTPPRAGRDRKCRAQAQASPRQPNTPGGRNYTWGGVHTGH